MVIALLPKHARVMQDGQGLCVMWPYVLKVAFKAPVTITLAAAPAFRAGRATCVTSQLAIRHACRESVCKARSLMLLR